MKRLGAPASSPASSEQPTGTSAVPALVPKLRFPEFRDKPEWEMKSLASYLQEAGERVSSATELPIYSSTRTGLKRQDDYYDGRVLLNQNDYGVVPVGCFVYRHMSDDGLFKFNINDTGTDIAVSKEYPVFRTVNLDPKFLLRKLNDGADFEEFAMSQKAGGTRTRLYFSKLSTWETLIPSLAEQQKIAECLSTLDELIGAESQKLDALKAHKKGLMQQLFPREGETLPRLRFPEFQDAPEWVVKPLCKMAENLDNRRIPITEKNRVRGSVPYYGASGIVDYVQDHIFDEHLLCVSEDGANLIARTYPIAFSIFGKTWVNNHAHVLRFADQSTQKMVEDYLNTLDLTDYLTGMAQPKLNKAMLDKIPIPFPEPEEQHRIASCLSSLDDLIAAQSTRIDALKTHKQGLMQQLFPSPAEATA